MLDCISSDLLHEALGYWLVLSSAAGWAFMEARKNANDSQPERILTDGLDKRKEGIRFAFGPRTPEHVARAGIKPRLHANNNRVERLNGTLRERVKVQSGWKSYGTKVAGGRGFTTISSSLMWPWKDRHQRRWQGFRLAGAISG